MVHVGNAREQISRLRRYEEDWCGMIRSHYPITPEPPAVKMPAYSVNSHREYAKLWRVRHLKSWERGVPMPTLLPELPEAVCIFVRAHLFLSILSQVRKVFRIYKGNGAKDGDGSAGLTTMTGSNPIVAPVTGHLGAVRQDRAARLARAHSMAARGTRPLSSFFTSTAPPQVLFRLKESTFFLLSLSSAGGT